MLGLDRTLDIGSKYFQARPDSGFMDIALARVWSAQFIFLARAIVCCSSHFQPNCKTLF